MYKKLFTIGLTCLMTLSVMTLTHVADAQDKITGSVALDDCSDGSESRRCEFHR